MLLQPAPCMQFATKKHRKQKEPAPEVEEIEEAQIIGEDSRPVRNFEEEFRTWLRKDLRQPEDKFVDFKRKKRSAFEKIGFNEHHIPHQGNYLKDKKKERLAQWDNPKFNWPPKLPRPSKHRGQTLLNHIDSEEKHAIDRSREFSVPNFRTGDVVELSMFQSLSDAKISTFKGLVYGKAKPNNLRQTLWFAGSSDNVNFTHKVKVYSPMVAKLQILRYGSNKNRKKLSHIPKLELSANRLTEPVIKGRGYKPRAAVSTGKKKMAGAKKAVEEEGEGVVKNLVLEELDDAAMKKVRMKLDPAERYE